MRYFNSCLIVILLVPVATAVGDEQGEHPAIVIDTDMGMDDAIALAMALQNPAVDVVAVVACEGVADPEKGTELLERMLVQFNRLDVLLYAPAAGAPPHSPPSFRPFAEQVVGNALSDAVKPNHRPFSPNAYSSQRKPIVVALGPLTNLAAALTAEPTVKDGIDKLVLPGSPDLRENWNLAYDEPAWSQVRASGIKLEFVVPGTNLRKPPSWREGNLRISQGTSVGEVFVARMLKDTQPREHYLTRWPGFSDELALLRCLEPDLFTGQSRTDSGVQPTAPTFAPRDGSAVLDLLIRCLGEGRQHKERVVMTERSWPDDLLQPDVRARASSIIAKNGETEWFAQLVTNELHDHLGAYSIIGAKMGLRAGELLNAPLHAMKVTSHSAAEPPVSCLNDGVIVATGSTPGRGLFSHVPGKAGSTQVAFAYNGREIILAVKPEYERQIAEEIGRLYKKYGLSQHEYWDGVRRFALEIWENWHRRDLFDVSSHRPGAPRATSQSEAAKRQRQTNEVRENE